MLHKYLPPPAVSDSPAARREKALLVGAVIVVLVTGYFLVAKLTNSHDARELRTAWDDAIPFWAPAMHPYALVYTAAFYPAFCIRDTTLFRRVASGYLIVSIASLLIFCAMPVTSLGLRIPRAALDLHRFEHWGLALTYAVDPPYNLFPSVHLSMATMAALSAYSARPLWGLMAAPGAIAVGASIALVKQHFIADGLAAVILAVGVWWWVVRSPEDAQNCEDAAFGWRGPLGYLGIHAGFYAIMYGLFVSGWTP